MSWRKPDSHKRCDEKGKDCDDKKGQVLEWPITLQVQQWFPDPNDFVNGLTRKVIGEP